MPAQDTSQVKERIMSFIRRSGPSLPVHIAKDVGLSILFTSAFLSEMFSEKTIKMSNLKVGSSPLYLFAGQEPMLEKFSQYLKSKEKEAFLLLKDKKILNDSEQEPAIRVALREIKDFAIPFKKEGNNESFYWRFFNSSEDAIKELEKQTPVIETEKKLEDSEIKIEVKEETEQEAEEKTKSDEEKLDIFDSEKKHQKAPKAKKSKKPKKKASPKEDNFFTRVKEFLEKKSIDFIDILTFNKNEIVLKVKDSGEEKIVVAFNQRKVSESDIIKASRKSEEQGLPYIILSTGAPLKKTNELIEAVKNLHAIEKLE